MEGFDESGGKAPDPLVPADSKKDFVIVILIFQEK